MNKLLTLFFCCLITLGSVVAQDDRIIIPKQTNQFEDKEGVILVFNANDASEIIVVNKNGEWVHDARRITMTADLVGKKPIEVECVMWKGLFEPETPRVEKWGLAGVISASEEEFKKILENLQNNRFLLN